MQIATLASAFALLAVSSYPASAGDWNSLGRVSRLRTVIVHLKSGREIKGTIQQTEPASLQLAPGNSRISVKTKELAGAVDSAQVGQIVELTTRGGQSLKGTLREANQYYVHLDETKSAVRISRDEIERITWRSRGLGALIGLAIGAGGGATFGAYSNRMADAGGTRGEAAGTGVGLFGPLGAAAGGIIGAERTLYKMPAPAPNPRR
jgi:small nuclear ribonucleoprotein (snRNP)-like protein